MYRLLLVDNDKNERILARAILRDDFPNIDIAERRNGQEACSHVSRTPPDLVLMDIQMPVMAGATATRQMRSKGYGGHIILRSASAILVQKLREQDIGATAVLDKCGEGGGYELNKFLKQYISQPTE